MYQHTASFARPAIGVAEALETDIAVLWAAREERCTLSWLGDRYRIRLERGSLLIRDDIDIDEHVVLDLSNRWRMEQAMSGARAAIGPR